MVEALECRGSTATGDSATDVRVDLAWAGSPGEVAVPWILGATHRLGGPLMEQA